MNKQTLKTLEESISHWDRICQGLEHPGGASACELCIRFSTQGSCWGCPIVTESFEHCCGNTPYYDDCVPCFDSLEYWFEQAEAIMARTSIPESWELKEVDTLTYAEACEKELIFLLGLLPKNHSWREQI